MKKRIAINSFFNVSSHFIRMLIAIFMTPYLLSKLGKEVYGILPIVNSLIAFLVLASGGIQSSVGRYATLNLAKNDSETANRYINTAFFLLAGMFCLVLIPFLTTVYFLPELLDIPAGHEFEAQIVFLLLGINLLVTMLLSPFSIGIYFKQRFEITNCISIAGQFLYVGLVVGSFHFFQPNIILVSLATLSNTLISSCFSILISKKLVPAMRFALSYFDRTKLRSIAIYSGWTLLIQATVLIFLNTDYIIINKLIGSSAVTDYSLASRFNEMLRAVITAAVAVIAPTCIQLEANGDFAQLRAVFIRGLRIVLLLVIPPCFLLCIFSKELLITWVGPDFSQIYVLFWIILLPQIIILAAMPANTILGSLGKVKWVGIANTLGAVGNLILSLCLVILFDMDVLGVAIASSIILSVKNLVFVPAYTAHVVKQPVAVYFYAFIKPLLAAIPMVALAFYVHIFYDVTGWIRLLASSAFCTLVYGVTAYFVAFEKSDKDDLKYSFLTIVMFKKRKKNDSL